LFSGEGRGKRMAKFVFSGRSLAVVSRLPFRQMMIYERRPIVSGSRLAGWSGLLITAVLALGWFGFIGATGPSSTHDKRPAGSAAMTSPPLGPSLVDPMEIVSHDGMLELTLEAAPSRITVAGQTFSSNVYNGQYIPPVFRLRRGDELRLRLVNRIGPADVQINQSQATNLHYHGMSISPKAPADDIYITIPSLQMVESGASNRSHDSGHRAMMREHFVYDYRFRVPQDHEQGSFWYHSHAHGHADAQVLSGLSGLFVIEGLTEDYYPWLAGVPQHVLLLKDIALPGADDDAPKTKTINGQANPTIPMATGEPQIWRLGNVGADSFFDLELDGHSFWVLERDANVLDRPVRESHVFISPGARQTVYVEPTSAGYYRLRSRMVDTGPQGDPNPDVVLATVAVADRRAGDSATTTSNRKPGLPLPSQRGEASPVEQLRQRRITGRRTITFSESADGHTFYVNGQQWDPDRIDVRVRVGDVEEWTVLNTSAEVHNFHIHQLDFLVTEINGERYDARSLLDTINVPYQQASVPGVVKIIVPFLNERMVGKFVFHCHILKHEDKGMMANIEVRAR
jgi:FtsP/CotA-like multicopper oxidase with cupredoxin domain